MNGPEALRLVVDRTRCEGYGLCEQAAPDLLQLNDDDEPVVALESIPPSSQALADAAVRACPVAALRLSAAAKPQQ
jgi:ferredoxin